MILIANSQTVNYSYHFGQLTEVNYPTNPENNVFYAYGNAGNATGRILTMQDAAGVHAFEYGSMGEVTLKKTTGYVPVSGGEFYTFSTRWQYDSWNRVKSIEYPDGELVGYDYDKGGQFVSMKGNKTNTQDYVTDVRYDEFGSRTYFAYGNGTSSTYTYDANSRRLLNLVSTTGNGDMLDLTYTYDDVGNITRINNTATGVNGLGGNYTYNYVYDSLYRLIDSHGNTGSGAGFELLMSYSPSGNIISKTLTATNEILGNTQVVNYANDYTYNSAHMVSMVNDINGNVPPLDFQFDGAGNMILQSVPDPNMGKHERLLCWDEENRLSATRDQYYATANIYDASGNRAWKLGGEVNWMWNNGQGWQAYGDLNLRTWYQSDLVTITDQAMTKHYFIAGQRIASKLAESLSPEVAQALKDKPVTPLSGDVNELGTNMTERLRRDFECVGLDYNAFYPGEVRLEALENLLNAPEQPAEYQLFFYHSDHLGSSSFITDVNGDATQHLQYLPFGEDFVHQQNTAAYYTPYTFSGKERDLETNLSYFGARYYESSLSIWLSVDPLSDKYPSLSAYNYCALNPVMLVDPDGRDIIIWYKENGKQTSYRYTGGSTNHSNPFVQKVAEAWNYNVGNGGGDPSFEAATNRNISINVVETEGNSMHLYGTVYWNPELGSQSDEGIVRSPASVLDHELDHAVQGKTNPNQFNEDRTPKNDKQYDTKEERRVITGSEQKTALANREIKKGQVTRTNHGGKTVIVNGVTSTTVNKQKTAEYVKKQQQRQMPSTE